MDLGFCPDERRGGSTVIGWSETATILASSFALFEDIENFLSEILNGDTGLCGADGRGQELHQIAPSATTSAWPRFRGLGHE